MLASNHNFISALAQEKHFNAVFSGNVSGVSASKVDGFVVFPDGDAGLSNSTATGFKSLYDANGNNTFAFYPEMYENMNRFDVQYTNWKNAIKSTLASPSVCSIGTKTDVFGKSLNSCSDASSGRKKQKPLDEENRHFTHKYFTAEGSIGAQHTH